MKPIKEGKVREMYDCGDSLVLVATDRISAFDVILKNKIVDKGAVLTRMSKFWFDLTKDIVPNHMISIDTKDMPEFFQSGDFNGNAMMCKKLDMLPIECIVRGYITGSGWKSYQENGTVCGIKLPDGLVESEKLPEAIYTPSTKAEIGDHDENISYEQSVEVLEKAYLGRGEELAKKIKDCTLKLYNTCADYALTKGIIIADTKFEFGLDENGAYALAWIRLWMENYNAQTDDGPICETLTAASATDQSGLLVYSKLRSIEESAETSVNNITVAAYQDGYQGIGGYGYCHYLFVTDNSPLPWTACAFISYLTTTKDGFSAWGKDMGGYSSNPTVMEETEEEYNHKEGGYVDGVDTYPAKDDRGYECGPETDTLCWRSPSTARMLTGQSAAGLRA